MAEANKKKRKRGNGVLRFFNTLLTIALIGLVIAAGVVLYGISQFGAEGPVHEDTTFLVEPGNSLTTIANRLAEQGLITDAMIFRVATVAQGRDRDIRAGEYAITANASMADILYQITEGEPISYGVTVPEGFTVWQVVQRVNADPNLSGEIAVTPPEGSLLPGTYDYRRGDTRQSVVDKMVAAMDQTLAQVWESRDPGLPLDNPGELVTLASIVEKETAVASERPEVASVFVNRLRANMRLQSDPTIIYGITMGEGVLGRGLLRSEIDRPTPYNTYQIDGLPPGPIANPGIESLRAVANPADTGYYYFVADGTGGHAFAENYADHQANVARWRQIEAEQAAAAAARAEEAEAALEEAEEPGTAPE